MTDIWIGENSDDRTKGWSQPLHDTCKCPRKDAQRCAAVQGYSSIFCSCGCHPQISAAEKFVARYLVDNADIIQEN